ncbi:MAG: oligosaccharide flippase family protein [Anaerolineales bacterium]|nr:oligosaccharide flippase family protein [Anaerolineales bacterium]
MSLAGRSTRGALALSLSTAANIGIGFLGGIWLARLLAPNDFGTFAVATALSAFVNLRSILQLEQQFLRDADAGPAHLDTFFTLSLGLAGLSAAVLWVAAAVVAGLGRNDLAGCLLLFSGVGLLDPLTAALRLSLEKTISFGGIAAAQTVGGLVQFGATLLGALAGWGLGSLLAGLAASTLVNLAWYWRFAPRRPAVRLEGARMRAFLTYGIKYGLVYAVSAITLTQADNLLVGALSGTAALGYYDRAYRTSSWPTVLIAAALGRISLPTYAKLQDDPARLSRAVGLVLWLVLTLTTPLALYILLTAPDLVSVLYTDKWLAAVPILQVLAAFAILRPLWDDLISILLATGRPGQMARLVFYQAAGLVLLAVPLTWFYGALGTAVAVGGAFSISAGFLLIFARRHLRVNLWDTAGWPLVCNLLALGAFVSVRPYLPLEALPGLGRLAALAGLWFGLYGAASLTLRGRFILVQLRYLVRAARA